MLALIGLSSVFAQLPTNGLVGYYPFNGNANNENGINNNGTITGATLTADRFGHVNSAYNFDGVNDYISIGTATFQSFSFSSWIYTTSVNPTNLNGIISNLNATAYQGVEFRINEDSTLMLVCGRGTSWLQPATTFKLMNNTWYNVVATSNNSTVKIYVNAQQIASYSISNFTNNTSNILFGTRNPAASNGGWYTGKLDDIGIWNRALSQQEITDVYNYTNCTDSTYNDTTTYFVSSPSFQASSPKSYFVNTENLTTTIGGCDSIVNHYLKYEYNPTYCSVTDTLIIDVTLTGVSAPNNTNTLKVYPNPAKDFVIIKTGNYSAMSNYTVKIENLLGQTVYATNINQAELQINVNSFGGLGTYIIKIIDNNSSVLETRKLILQ